MISLFTAIILSFGLIGSAWGSESLRDSHVRIDWLAPQTFSVHEETLVGIRFRPDPHWHVYWKNPGDSGAAPKFSIQAQGAEVGPVLWPYPVRLPVAHLTNFGYEGETVYFFKVQPPAKASLIELEVSLEWLVCQEECVPGFGKLKLSRATTTEASFFPEGIKKKLSEHARKIPLPGEGSFYFLKVVGETESTLTVAVTSKELKPRHIDLFPVNPEFLLPEKPVIQKIADGFEVVFKKSATAPKPRSLGFVFVAEAQAFEFQDISTLAVAPPVATDPVWLVLLFFSAFIGGMLLNLMPCVFPVISIKVFSLLKTQTPSMRRQDGLLYSAGVLTTFILLGAGFLLLRHLGAAVGWGFQLQSPLAVFSLIILFWIMALNFLGVFEWGTAVMNSSGQVPWRSSFGSGILSVFVAAPCTGPFMGTALGATATLPALSSVLVFVFLGLGLAFPYLLLTFSERLARRLPKPGAWMETLKQFLAFPLFATVLWLLWVLGQQTGADGWFYGTMAVLGLSFCFWLGQRTRRIWSMMAWVAAVMLLVVVAVKIHRLAEAEVVVSPSAWQSYSEQKLEEALQKGQPVFVDFTAAWCITCQVNKKTVLETATAEEIFTRGGVLRLRADWTKQDAHITQALARLERNSVPVYAFYGTGSSEPEILPQILTMEMIRKLIPMKEEK